MSTRSSLHGPAFWLVYSLTGTNGAWRKDVTKWHICFSTTGWKPRVNAASRASSRNQFDNHKDNMSGRGKGGKGLGKGGAKVLSLDPTLGCSVAYILETPKGHSWFHPRYHQASHQTSCAPWWSQAYFWPDLRRNSWSPQSVLGECYQRRCHLHWARQKKDCDLNGRRVCSQETRTYSVRIWRVNHCNALPTTWCLRHHLLFSITHLFHVVLFV
jgi:hypothetical protein